MLALDILYIPKRKRGAKGQDQNSSTMPLFKSKILPQNNVNEQGNTQRINAPNVTKGGKFFASAHTL